MRQVTFGWMTGILALSSLATGGSAVADDSSTGRVTVSGISSGAYAAVQSHIALSSTISGAAAIAGGPYHCAEGNVMQALGGCISGADLDVSPLIEATHSAARAGTITASSARPWRTS